MKKPDNKALKFIGLGWLIATSIIGLFFLGHWLDTKFDTKPLFMLIGLFNAFVIIGFELYKIVKQS